MKILKFFSLLTSTAFSLIIGVTVVVTIASLINGVDFGTQFTNWFM